MKLKNKLLVPTLGTMLITPISLAYTSCSCNNASFNVTVKGAKWNKDKSVLKLNERSKIYIILGDGETINADKTTVKVGGKKITPIIGGNYIIINAKDMTNLNIEINVSIDKSGVVTIPLKETESGQKEDDPVYESPKFNIDMNKKYQITLETPDSANCTSFSLLVQDTTTPKTIFPILDINNMEGYDENKKELAFEEEVEDEFVVVNYKEPGTKFNNKTGIIIYAKFTKSLANAKITTMFH